MSLVAFARFTLLELWRQKLAMLPVAIAVLMAVLLYGIHVVTGAQPSTGPKPLTGSVPWTMAIQVLPTLGAIIGVLASAGAIAGEVERGTALLLVTRQPRWTFVLGKALGIFAFLLATFAGWGVVLVLAWLLTGGPVDGAGRLFGGTLLGILPGCLAASFALLLSAVSTAQGSLAGSVMAYLIKGVAGTFLATGFTSWPSLTWGARAITYVLPSDRLGEIASLMAIGSGPTAAHGWALLAPIAWLGLAIAAFSRRDL